MERKVEGIHTGFLRRIMGKRTRRLVDRTWDTPGAEGLQEAAETQSAMTYLRKRKATMEQWVTLRPLYEV